MGAGTLDCILAPGGGGKSETGWLCADNGCFGKGYPGEEKWWEWLLALPHDRLRFAVAPDVVGDAVATIKRSAPWLPRIRALGVPAAFVGQDGLEDLQVPWDTFDVFFIGGSTEWKLSEAVRTLVAEAKRRGKWVHMGRVNSRRRLRYAHAIGCDSADGTYLAFGPDVNLPNLIRWVEEIHATTEIPESWLIPPLPRQPAVVP